MKIKRLVAVAAISLASLGLAAGVAQGHNSAGEGKWPLASSVSSVTP